MISKALRRLAGALIVALCLFVTHSQATSPPQDNKSYRGDVDGDFAISLVDFNAARDRSLLRPVDYSAVVPGDAIKGDTADVTGDGVVDVGDINALKDIALLRNYSTPDLPWTLDTSGIPASVTGNAPIQAAVTNVSAIGRPGIVVRFSVSSGPAVVRGREYNPANDNIRDHESPPGATAALAITLTDFPGDQTGATELTIPNVGAPVKLYCNGVGLVTLDVDVLADPIKGIPALSSSVPITCTATSEECSDGYDNDGDTLTDFPSDPGCTDTTDTSELDTNECDDGIDNDGDTLTDYPEDPDCFDFEDTKEANAPECSDGADNDLDLATDYPDDTGCASALDQTERGIKTCDDGFDNDGDTFTDYPNDPGCSSILDLFEWGTNECDDLVDNDGDTLFDYPEDPGCNDISDTSELLLTECDDGVDNDGDTITDFPGDPGCSDIFDLSEYGFNECDDGLDNDTDVYTDYPADSGCYSLEDPSEYGENECDDGTDNDGDTLIDYPTDPGCENLKIGSNIRITYSPNYTGFINPSLVWTGSEYGLAWEENAEIDGIYFTRLDSTGVKIGSNVRIPNNGGISQYPTLVWTGSEYGVAWYDNRDGNYEIYFARIDASGVKIGPDVRITNNAGISEYPTLVWAGSEYGVAWHDNRDGKNEIYFARINASGIKTGADSRITNYAGVSEYPSLAWTGSEYGVAWKDNRDGNREIYFARINASGIKTGADSRITNDPGVSEYASLVWTETEYGVAWDDSRDGSSEIYFARIDASGLKIGADTRITNDPGVSEYASLVWTGTEYGISWDDQRDGNYEIYFASIDASGVKIAADVRITNNELMSIQSSLVSAGLEYGFIWSDNIDLNRELFFARIGSGIKDVSED